MSQPQFYRVKAPFATPTRVHKAGQVLAASDPEITKGRLQFLEPLGVEQATAAPGERRAVRMPAPPPASVASPDSSETESPTGMTTKSLPKAKKGR